MNQSKLKFQVLPILMSLILYALGSATIVTADGPRAVGVTLTITPMNPASTTADVTATSPASATFTATVTVDKPPLIGTVMVSLDASVSTGWPAAVSPQSIPFTSPSSVQVTVTVTVPAQSPSSLVGAVRLNGVATYPGGSKSAGSSATVLVGQYYMCKLNATPTTGSGNPQTYDVRITNDGNGNDSFEITTTEQNAVSKAGLTVTMEKTKTGNLPAGQSETIHVKVSYGSSTSTGKHQINVHVVSVGSNTGSNETATADLPLTIDVQPWSGQGGITIGIVAAMIIVVVIVVVFLAMKKGKLKFKNKEKDAPKAQLEKKEEVKTDDKKKEIKEK